MKRGSDPVPVCVMAVAVGVLVLCLLFAVAAAGAALAIRAWVGLVSLTHRRGTPARFPRGNGPGVLS